MLPPEMTIARPLKAKPVASVPMNELTCVTSIASPFTRPSAEPAAEPRDDAQRPAGERSRRRRPTIAATVAVEATERSKMPAMMQTVIAVVTTSSSRRLVEDVEQVLLAAGTCPVETASDQEQQARKNTMP